MEKQIIPKSAASENDLIRKLISVSPAFDHVCILFSNNFPTAEIKFLAGIGSSEKFSSLKELEEKISQSPGFLFGHLSYDLKNEIENLVSENPDGIDFPLVNFFVPEFLVQHKNNKFIVTAAGNKTEEDLFLNIPEKHFKSEKEILIRARTGREEYISNVKELLNHIHRGDIYEINYCIEFFAGNVSLDPVATFNKLTGLTEAPFSVLYKNDEHWLMCGSPERFLQKKGSKIISQPIKGTKTRGQSKNEDEKFRKELFLDPKERSENVMIVDLVRNDLSRFAKKGSVKVEELFGIHSFKSVHQMISTVSAEVDEKINPVEIIRTAFPMGSMTGAPKIRAMELAEKFENMKRGLYSGSVGYFTPENDFDFNVVIRSIQYNAKTGYLSIMVGSAITANSDPEKEYDECLLKAKALFDALGITFRP